MFRKSLVVLFLFITTSVFAQDQEQFRRRYNTINNYINSINTEFSKDLIKAVAWGESEWTQFGENGRVYCSTNDAGDIIDVGIMQINITVHKGFNHRKLRSSTRYNIMCGVDLLESNLKNAKRIRALYHVSKKRSDIDICLRLYNGWSPKVGWTYVDYIHRIQKRRPWKKYIEGG